MKILSVIFLIAVGVAVLFIEHDATVLVMFSIFSVAIALPDKPRRSRKKNIRYIERSLITYEKAKHWRNGTEIRH